jgi:hypothetical protein
LEESLDWALAYAETVDPLAGLRADLKKAAERSAREKPAPDAAGPSADASDPPPTDDDEET